MKIIRGNTTPLISVCYLDSWGNQIADVTGATIKAVFKKNPKDSGADVIIPTKRVGSGVTIIAPGTNGVVQTLLTATETNAISQNKIFFELVVKLADGTFIRNGIEEIEVTGNVLKTLF